MKLGKWKTTMWFYRKVVQLYYSKCISDTDLSPERKVETERFNGEEQHREKVMGGKHYRGTIAGEEKEKGSMYNKQSGVTCRETEGREEKSATGRQR
ncbi:hypothetical protein TNCV_3689181 [Trichonephila clavipes]|uniref:Uncharacterized protein n=1 Tax=Trichonephila clavipes TaxID=2585209 RepID=A0A8X6SSZ4_TRICX|nr:hypothetical protein TNCV_3689181 [Trichonephila clavipes]